MENYEIVRKAASQKGDSDVVAAEKSLGEMLAARAQAMGAKAAVQEAILTKLSGEEVGACAQELAEFKEACAAVEEERSAVYVNYYSAEGAESGDQFRQDLL